MNWYALPPSGNAVPITSLLRRHHGDFAGALAAHAGLPRENVLLTSSGSGALWLGLRALRALEPRRRAVAVPAWCCPSVPRAVMQAGLEPVPVDIDPSSLGYDTSALLAARGRGLLAVVLAHFFGMAQPKPPGDWDGAVFIRDCAQDFEHRPDDGLPCFYSFGRGKALNAGHGGALCLPPGPWLEGARRLLETLPVSRDRVLPKVLAINLLSEPHIYWALSRLPLGLGKTEWHHVEAARAAAGFEEAALACLEAYQSRRDYYRRLIGEYRSLFSACDGDWITVPAGAPEDWLPARFPVLVRDARLREALFARVDEGFGGVTRMYPAVLDKLPGAPAGFAEGQSFPGAERVAGEILTLPVTAELMGQEGELLESIADLLESEGVLKGRIRSAAPEPETPDWVPVPDYLPLA